MNLEQFKQTVREVVPFFYWRDNYDEKYIIRSMLEIIEKRQEYEDFSQQFQYLPAEFVFFIKISFGELEGRTKQILQDAEEKYRLEVSRDKISRDLLLEAISKSCILAFKNETSFRQEFAHSIVKKTVDTKIVLKKEGKACSLNTSLHIALNNLANCGVYPENLFFRQVTTTP